MSSLRWNNHTMLIIFYLLLILRVGRCTGQIFQTKTVGVGDNVKLTCPRDNLGSLFWIRLVPGNVPEVLGRTFSFHSVDPRIKATEETETFLLRINKAKRSDTGLYYCVKTRQKLAFLKGMDLRVEGSEPGITTAPPSDPVRPGDSVTLQCSVLSDSENTTFPGEHSVCCIRSGSNQSHPSFSFTLGDSVEEYEKTTEGLSTRKCANSFFKNISSSGIYYCSVATHVEIFGGNSSKPDIEADNMGDWQDNTLLSLLSAALAISLIVIAFLIYSIKKLKTNSCGCCKAAVALQRTAATVSVDHQSQQTDEDSLIYSAPTFTRRKSGEAMRRDANTEEEESIYTDVKDLGLN